jgi:hypothetical protein
MSNQQLHSNITDNNSEKSIKLDSDYEKQAIKNEEFDIEEAHDMYYETEGMIHDMPQIILFENLYKILFSGPGGFENLTNSYPNTKFDKEVFQKLDYKWNKIYENLKYIFENIPSNFDWDNEEFLIIIAGIKELTKAKTRAYSAALLTNDIGELYYNIRFFKGKSDFWLSIKLKSY